MKEIAMKRTLTAALATLAVLTTAPLAMAQKAEFGQQGEFIISADRLLPLFGFSSFSFDNGTAPNQTKNTTTISQTSLSFLYGGTPSPDLLGNGSNGVGANLFYTVPRLGFDYVIVPNVTIGGDIVLYFTLGGSTSTEVDTNDGRNTNISNGNPSTTLFGLAPRGGYILQLNDMFSLWLRGGFSYYTATAKQTVPNGGPSTSGSEQQPSIDLDPQMVFTPIPHVGFTGGLTADIPFAGRVSTTTTNGGQTVNVSNSASALYIGLTLGMLAHF
jgi:hypothetical protein